jgi:hypothetical protein
MTFGAQASIARELACKLHLDFFRLGCMRSKANKSFVLLEDKVVSDAAEKST